MRSAIAVFVALFGALLANPGCAQDRTGSVLIQPMASQVAPVDIGTLGAYAAHAAVGLSDDPAMLFLGDTTETELQLRNLLHRPDIRDLFATGAAQDPDTILQKALASGAIDAWQVPQIAYLQERKALVDSLDTFDTLQKSRALDLNAALLARASTCLACLGTIEFPIAVPPEFAKVGLADIGATQVAANPQFQSIAKDKLTALVQGWIDTVNARGGALQQVKYEPADETTLGLRYAITFRLLIFSQDWRKDDDGWDHFEITAAFVPSPYSSTKIIDVLVIADDYQRIGGPFGVPDFDAKYDRNIRTADRRKREADFVSEIHTAAKGAIDPTYALVASDDTAPATNPPKMCN